MPTALVRPKKNILKSFNIFAKKTVFNDQCPLASFLIFSRAVVNSIAL